MEKKKIQIIKKSLSVTASHEVPFNVVVVEPGQRYGLDDCLVNTDPERSYFEFYDARYAHTQYGQFISRYYLETLLGRSREFILDGQVPDWRIDSGTWSIINAWFGNLVAYGLK